jgi:hypothetical protein
MANDKLEAFLSANAPDAPAPPATEPPAAPPPEPPHQEPDKPQPTQAPPKAPETDEDEPPRDARDGEPAVPRQALIDERTKRQDWKDRASRAEALAEERRQQLEQLQNQREAAARPQPQQEPQFRFADPQQDPALYAAQQAQNAVYNTSELLARQLHGDEVVDKAVEEFIGLAQRDPTLWHRMQQQRHPFEWVRREVERQKLLHEIEDPEKYKAKLRAEWEAERAAQMPPAVATPANTPPPNMPPSLANVRSAAPRTAPQWSGPLSDTQAANYFREHRMANRR